ncbi:tripartite tricarboxylate transporter TctB family protein [Micromonospora sp. NPDC007230]|uniref:tripartite tricarboxylate transporter TctB family protein n=1 Tax=Micromonospora sp. NPDC007230 TaxID=3364237 RepID=UPI0036A977A9
MKLFPHVVRRPSSAPGQWLSLDVQVRQNPLDVSEGLDGLVRGLHHPWHIRETLFHYVKQEVSVEMHSGDEVARTAGRDVRPLGAWAAQAVLIAIAVYVVISARALGIWLPQGPGPGFFPLVLAVALVLLSVAWFIQTRRAAAGSSAGEASPWKQPAVTIASLVVLAAVLNFLGFQASMLLFLLFHLKVMGRRGWLTSIVIAVAGSIGAFYLFNDFLLVPLPYATVPPLSWLGV